MKINLSTIFTFLLFFSFVTNIEYINITITDQSDPSTSITLGPNGTIALVTDRDNLTSIFNRSDIENQTHFQGRFRVRESIDVYLDCRLWDPEDINVIVLCKIDEQMYGIELENCSLIDGTIYTKNYTINIEGQYHFFDIDLKEFNIPFIYSDLHYIDLNSDKDSFELRFKTDSYLGEDLALVDKTQLEAMTGLDEISLSDNELVFNLSRKKIEEVLTETKTLSLIFLSPELGPLFFPIRR